MRIKPAREGLIVLDPATYFPLPAEGAEVPETSYWQRRLLDGDVVLVTQSPAPAAPARARAPKE